MNMRRGLVILAILIVPAMVPRTLWADGFCDAHSDCGPGRICNSDGICQEPPGPYGIGEGPVIRTYTSCHFDYYTGRRYCRHHSRPGQVCWQEDLPLLNWTCR